MTVARSIAWRLATDPIVMIAIGLTGAAAVASSGAAEIPTPAIVAAKPTVAPMPAKPIAKVSRDQAPAGTAIEMSFAVEAGRSLAEQIAASGAANNDSDRAASLVGPSLPDGSNLTLWLGEKGTDGTRPILKLLAKPSFDRAVVIVPVNGALQATHHSTTVDATPKRFSGLVGDGLYWSLRKAGVSAGSAQEYLGAIAGRVDLTTVRRNDRFDLIADQRRSATGETRAGPLLYVALLRPGNQPIELVRWTVQGRDSWLDPDQSDAAEEQLSLPSGTISSRFGYRFHPVLHRSRLHRGVDVRASYGTAVYAAGDGRVAAAGWAGGYGNQVRLAHDDAMTTSYSHLSRIVAEPGASVRKGQLIGFVGSTGLSTGPHLHFEVMERGRAVDPLGGALSARRTIDPSDRAALPVRLKQLMEIHPAKG
ncbi:M23 family metallopeptidase [Sphingomonas sp. LY29]|uniref:M23 family metallopeptidase n=1 Tax=Sphingomonas sp. LY29 TaxID=3095341 RepID=UPI002D793C30|nr:M23 family metallopeptidase [Sphingomonas sp. LY29]WRP26819.1 M23 family metallopeptidase [Sphingomonas sp. LY29]